MSDLFDNYTTKQFGLHVTHEDGTYCFRKVQYCPEATVHGDIASYSGYVRLLLFCKIKEIFVYTKYKHAKLMKY